MLDFKTSSVSKKTKQIMRSLLLWILFCTMILCNFNIVCAKGDTPIIEKSGDLDNFAKNAPITTVRLDGSKFIRGNATLTYEMKNKYKDTNKFEWGNIQFDGRDSVVIKNLTTESTANGDDGVMEPGSFTLTYKDAAIMRDGTKRDFSATYTPQILMQQNTSSYTDDFTIATIYISGKPGVTVNPQSAAGIHFGLRVYVSCRVVGNDTDNLTGETFLLVSDEINTTRTGSNYSNIVYASANNNYSEAIKFESGIDGESDIYLTENTILRPRDDTNNSNAVIDNLDGVNGYSVRLVATGENTPKESPSHVAAAASASGIRARIWSSAGLSVIDNDPVSPLDTYYLDLDDFTKDYTSSSGDNGKIELWTDGQTHDTDSEVNNFRKLSGGTINTPYTYAVPNSKGVTYRMTPNDGYILDKLYVNGSEMFPTNTVYKLDSTEIAYYEYSFDGDSVNSDQEISVTWKKNTATTNPILVRKIITGSVPDKDQEFTIVLEHVPVSDMPLDGPASNNVDKINLNVLKGQTEVNSEIPGLTFTKPGEYTYTVKELNENAEGYTYDDKVYTVKFVIEYDQNNPGVLICTQQTILDGENEVDSCEFINNYESTNENNENGDDNTDHGKSDNETDIESIDNTDDENLNSDDNTSPSNIFEKTGDQIYFTVGVLAFVSLICGVLIIALKKSKKG